MLRKIRILAATCCFGIITLLFLDFTGTAHHWFGWLAKGQFVPALLALNVAVVGGLILLTSVFGRIYCSVLCPLGVFQDLVSRAADSRTRNRHSHTSALHAVRHGILVLFALSIAVGLTPVMTLLDPYGAFGRMASNLLSIPYMWGNNLLAHLARRMDSYAFYSVDVWLKSAGTLAAALLTLGIVSLLAWRNGRTYCNIICPVGTSLGVVSRFSLFKPRIDRRKCAQCGLCEKGCKSSCIDAASGEIDHSRCVVCLNCTENCRLNAIRYSRKEDAGEQAHGVMEDLDRNGLARRNFLAVSTLLAVGAATKARAKQFDGGLALIKDKEAPARTASIVPPGAQGVRNFSRHCTACQLCVSGCPNQVLRPSAAMNGFMQPEMSFERGYCRPECTRCGQVCPTGAIHAVTAAEKSAIQIGHAVWNWDRCIVNTDRVSCNTCARHCPTGAIKMIPRQLDNPASPRFPMIDINRCTGCGACENLCPARPLSAIHVDGHEMHKTI